jgi:superfamily I DNA/RNA helicase
MTVWFGKSSKIHQIIKRLKRSGGSAERAGAKAESIISALINGSLPNQAGSLTDHGESRIKGCIKWKLGDGYRLVAVRSVDSVSTYEIVFLGTHDATDHLIESHRGYRSVVTVDQSNDVSAVHALFDQRVLMPAERFKQDVEREIDTASHNVLLHYLSAADLDVLNLTRREEAQLQVLTERSSDQQIADVVAGLKSAHPELLTVMIDLRSWAFDRVIARLDELSGRSITADDEQFDAALKQAPDVVVLRDLTAQEFERLFATDDIEDWMVFLHPDQKRVAFGNYEGTTYLKGVSGSGKTSVLVHRAKYLAEQYPDEVIAIVTLNSSLARFLERLVNRLCDEVVAQRIHVHAMHELCTKMIRHFVPSEVLQTYDPKNKENLEDNWNESYDKAEQKNRLKPIIESLAGRGVADPQRYIRDEFIWVRSAFGSDESVSYTEAPTRKRYLDTKHAPRKGREIPFSKGWRQAVLDGLDHYESWLEAGGFVDPAARALKGHQLIPRLRLEGGHPFRYRSVLVDEVQDLGTVELELLSALVSEQAANSLFLAGDPCQRVFPKYYDWRDAGISIKNKPRFNKNYRNTREIMQLAVDVLQTHGDKGEFAQPLPAARNGGFPQVIGCIGESAEMDVVQAILEQRAAVAPVCLVVCGIRDDDDTSLANRIGLMQKALPSYKLSLLTHDVQLSKGRVYVTTLEASKGFEFPTVVIVNCSTDKIPAPSTPKEERWREANRLYVACTRARDELFITYRQSQGGPSLFLGALSSEAFVTCNSDDFLAQQTTSARDSSETLSPPKTVSVTTSRQRNRCRVAGCKMGTIDGWNCRECSAPT